MFYTTNQKSPGDDKMTTVVKKMLQVLGDEEKKLFSKEMALVHDLKHKNIVEFKAVCFQPLAMMLEYVYSRAALETDNKSFKDTRVWKKIKLS